jgi:multiphosphoryl transfer protein
MVGLVVVSHSRALARAAVALAEEMVRGQDVPIAIAAGLDETTLGTDAVQIVDALHAVDRGDGVVVLMDLGSAVLSAELALDLLEDDEARQRVLLCPAPLVEGLVAAAVAAAAGSSAQEVAAEARRALAGKESHLGPSAEPPAAAPRELASEANGRFTVRNPHGLHARPAALLVQRLRAVDGRVQLRNATTGSDWVSATSLSRVATLGAMLGHEVEVRADGPRADEAVQTVLALAADSFGEAAPSGKLGTPPVPIARIPASEPTGVAPGIGIGPALHVTSDVVDVPAERTEDPARDWLRLVDAIARSRADIVRARDRVAIEAGDEEAAILDAHVLLLDDAELLNDVETRVQSGQAAASAWSAAIIDVGGRLSALPDPYLQARADDVRAVGGHVLRQLLGGRPRNASRAGVIVADDLSPVEVAQLDRTVVAAVVLAYGSATSHSAILIRSRGIPTIVRAGEAVLEIPDGTQLAVDGSLGEVVVAPTPDVLKEFQARATAAAARDRRALAWAAAPAVTQDGVSVLIGANVGSIDEAKAAAANGADRAGLVRTEFLFLERSHPPSVDEQEAVYRDLAQVMGGRRIVVRTLDVGGDKPLRFLPQPIEANPFLGVRGIRFALRYPQLLADQLLAIVRVAHDFPVSVLFPMVSALDELTAARRLLDEAATATGRGTPPGLEIGIMVEVPAAALNASVFIPHVDFFSIGTNDLTQYAMASERGSSALAALADPLDPAVLRLIDLVGRAAGDRLPVAVCGELAADERATGLLVGLGVRELSVVPTAVPAIKQAVRDLTSAEAGTLAATALTKGSAADVRALLRAGS